MQQETPLKNFEAKVGDFLLRINLMSEEVSDISHFNEGLSIYAANYVEKYCIEQFYNIENIPKEAITIFFDLQTFFDYIVQNHADPARLQIRDDGIVVCNIIKARGIMRRQEVILGMSKKPIEEPEKPEEVEKLDSYAELKVQNEAVKLALHNLKQQFSDLQSKNLQLHEQVKKLQQKNIKDCEANHTQILQQEKNTHILAQSNQLFKEFMNDSRIELRYLNQAMNQLKREIAEQKQQNSELKQQIRQLRKMVKEIKISPINPFRDPLGQKIEVTIDKSNPYLAKYITNDGSIEKVDGDETRFQVLGNETLGNGSRTYFEVRILNLMSNGLIIGIVSDIRKGQRHSYDQKECICYDGTGKIFETGKKWPVPVKFQAGQVVRVMIDLEQSMIRWFISFTEVGSAFIPDTLRGSRLVPYFELNEVKDKIMLNK